MLVMMMMMIMANGEYDAASRWQWTRSEGSWRDVWQRLLHLIQTSSTGSQIKMRAMITNNVALMYLWRWFLTKTKDFIIVAKYHFIDYLLPGGSGPHFILTGAIPKSVQLVLAMMLIKICRTSLTTEVNCFASTSVGRNTLYSGGKYFVFRWEILCVQVRNTLCSCEKYSVLKLCNCECDNIFLYCMKIFAALLRKDFPETSQRFERRLLSESILKMKSQNFGVTLYNIRDTDKLQIRDTEALPHIIIFTWSKMRALLRGNLKSRIIQIISAATKRMSGTWAIKNIGDNFEERLLFWM